MAHALEYSKALTRKGHRFAAQWGKALWTVRRKRWQESTTRHLKKDEVRSTVGQNLNWLSKCLSKDCSARSYPRIWVMYKKKKTLIHTRPVMLPSWLSALLVACKRPKGWIYRTENTHLNWYIMQATRSTYLSACITHKCEGGNKYTQN